MEAVVNIQSTSPHVRPAAFVGLFCRTKYCSAVPAAVGGVLPFSGHSGGSPDLWQYERSNGPVSAFTLKVMTLLVYRCTWTVYHLSRGIELVNHIR